ncbi:transmembrane 136 isoform X1 isoform B [Micractinium conductrix]|uniref:Transmembrane 136 isoform X1 isoform A n=1 Tax=Micractinium conductrix TaxID=554055 RepID=A0A2P6V228_9CHLO|nr:transmembrane 136 isoform X1 isoform A [Micractinium conductrix]PSC68141.1 transmembrane 136 isoform X1 isoform B [Micractinium conductrix]|eukprot:PSC68140.1 transmembrane 136 isoform X1 isoform A [Micractinium conductrix]
MGSPTFPVERINRVAAVSCAIWTLVSVAVHLAAQALWPAYRKTMRPSERRQFCNKVACGLHAAVLSYNQAFNLFDPVLTDDPLHGVTDDHFYWGSVLLGYLAYDTAFSLVMFPLRSGAVMLAHHVVGLAGCVIGVYYNKLALFGLAIEVFFESCNPLLHTLGCMRLARRSGGAAYLALSRLFVAQFFLFRVLIANAYFGWMLHCVLRETERPWWAWAGVAVFASLNTLNFVWLFKLVAMVRAKGAQRRAAKLRNGGGQLSTATPAADPPSGKLAGEPADASRRTVDLSADATASSHNKDK